MENKTSRIHLTGASGSGVSTLGTNLSKALSIPVFDTDDYYWMPTDPPFITKRPIPSRITLIQADTTKAQTEHGGWVLSGSLGTWGGPIMEEVQHVIYVDTPTEVRMKRLEVREFKRHGERVRPGGDMYEESVKFLEWAARYEDPTLDEGRSRKMHEEWMKEVKVPVTRLDGSKGEDVVLGEALVALGRKSGE
jgi:adenylate kinase family enzyme